MPKRTKRGPGSYQRLLKEPIDRRGTVLELNESGEALGVVGVRRIGAGLIGYHDSCLSMVRA
jgi:hypothetical protein